MDFALQENIIIVNVDKKKKRIAHCYGIMFLLFSEKYLLIE